MGINTPPAIRVASFIRHALALPCRGARYGLLTAAVRLHPFRQPETWDAIGALFAWGAAFVSRQVVSCDLARVPPVESVDGPPRQSPRGCAMMRANFSIRTARAELRRALASVPRNEYAMYCNLRDVGITWIDICAWCDDPTQHGGKKISAHKWAQDNAPIKKRWLDEHASFARRWHEFAACWKWTQEMDYSSERRPSLRAAFDLMDTKKRADTYHSAVVRSRSSERVGPQTEGTTEPTEDECIIASPTTTVLRGDGAKMMRKHVLDGAIDLMTVDVPYYLNMPDQENKADYHTERYGMTP